MLNAVLDSLPAGDAIGGYEIVRVLGVGGFGITYEAQNPVTRRRVAIKEFFPAGLSRRGAASQVVYTQAEPGVIAWALEKFKATTTLICELNHPNILRVLDYWPANGTGYMVMEYLEGRTFEAWLDQMAPHRPEVHQLRPVLDPVLDALAYVHGRGLIHRDIAPDNIVITDEGRPVLIDFGALSQDVSRATRYAGTRGLHKPGYTAPEQATFDARPDPASDIYSVGAVLYRALAGERPKDGRDRATEIAMGDADPCPALAQRGDLDPVLAGVADACLSIRKADRPQTVQAVRERLGWTAVQPPPAPPEAPPDPGRTGPDFSVESSAAPIRAAPSPAPPPPAVSPPDPPRRSRIVLTLLAAVALIGAAGGAVLVQRRAWDERQRLAAETAARVRQEAALACDSGAASPDDADRAPDVAVAASQLDAPSAAKACRTAVEAAGAEPPRRLLFQLGRALAAQGSDDARRWYERAAQAGSLAAMNGLGLLLDRGQGGAADPAAARAWYEQAAAAGDPDPMVNLGNLFLDGRGAPQDDAQARGWYERAAAAGNAAAMNNLGVLSDRGRGVKQDYAQARLWWEKAAAAGNAAAMNNLGLLHHYGRGVKQDYAQARGWYERAAALGNAAAMNYLGFSYERGRGVPADDAQARLWYERAAAAGNAVAMRELGDRYELGSGVPRDLAQAHLWYKKAAELGDTNAMVRLAFTYNQGRGVRQDLALARAWYAKADAAREQRQEPALLEPRPVLSTHLGDR